MNKRLLPFTLACLLACSASPLLRAQDKREHGESHTELGNTMEKFSGAWRKLRKQVADPASNASSLELLATIKAGLEKALPMTPAKAETMPAPEHEKFVADYRAKMKEFLALLARLETALKANDNPAAQDLMQKIGAAQKEDHRAFKKPEM